MNCYPGATLHKNLEILLKIKELGFLVVGLNKYLNRKSLVRRDEAEEYILKLYKKQAEKKLITKKI